MRTGTCVGIRCTLPGELGPIVVALSCDRDSRETLLSSEASRYSTIRLSHRKNGFRDLFQCTLSICREFCMCLQNTVLRRHRCRIPKGIALHGPHGGRLHRTSPGPVSSKRSQQKKCRGYAALQNAYTLLLSHVADPSTVWELGLRILPTAAANSQASRCCGSIVLASAADMPKKPGSKNSAPSTKPPWRAYITFPSACNALLSGAPRCHAPHVALLRRASMS